MATDFPISFPASFGWGDGAGIQPVRDHGAPHRVITDDQIVSIHTYDGRQLYQFTPDTYTQLKWNRQLRNPSRCDLDTPPIDDSDRLPDIVPWLHWCSVWDQHETSLLWTGPILQARASRSGLSLNARDHSAYLTRTWTPMSRRWEATDPAYIAEPLWDAMIAHHGLNVAPIARPDPKGDRFDFQTVAEEQMLDQTLDQLVQLGLRWTVVNGIPVLGPVSLEPIATLGEADFLNGDIGLMRDGQSSFNNVLVRGANALAREKVDMYGLDLQTIANIDSMFSVSNVQRAAHQYARHTASIRTSLDIPGGAELHPEAPVDIRRLIPSTRFVVAAHGLRELVELETVEVLRVSGKTSVKVTVESVLDLPEISELAAAGTGAATTSGGSL